MSVITKEVTLTWNYTTKERYESMGYVFTKIGDCFEVKVEDLQPYSAAVVLIKCDGDGCDYSCEMPYKYYSPRIKQDGKYYCKKCVCEKFSGKKYTETILKKSPSFAEYCLDNGMEKLLELWDYDLNSVSPYKILPHTQVKYYFKCPKHLHESTRHNILNLVNNGCNSVYCIKCNSFAQFGIDNVDKNFLEKYWDFEKNKIDPWAIMKSSNVKVWIKCQKKEYHESYDILCGNFSIGGNRCPYCGHTRLNIQDSLGSYIIKNYGEDFFNKIWSSRNKKSPFKYTKNTAQKIWWNCANGEHPAYIRSANNSLPREYRCPLCEFSTGESFICDFLSRNGFVNGIDYVCQKKYDGLVGTYGGLLSYDFYLENNNLLIEYQGQYHDGSIHKVSPKHQTLEMLNKQIEHDRRKREYAKNNGIKLLEIWYWDFDKIEDILTKELNLERK